MRVLVVEVWVRAVCGCCFASSAHPLRPPWCILLPYFRLQSHLEKHGKHADQEKVADLLAQVSALRFGWVLGSSPLRFG